MSMSVAFNSAVVRQEAANRAARSYDVTGVIARESSLRLWAAGALRRVAELQLTLASRIDAEPTAA